MRLFVNGELMRGLSMHGLMEKATFVKEAQTTPIYRLFTIDDQYPAMIIAPPGRQGYAIAGELYEIPQEIWPILFNNERRLGLYRGYIWLSDGQAEYGILSVPELCEDYPDISSYGGWRAYRQTRTNN